MLRILRLLIVILVAVTGLAIHLRNDQIVRFDYYLGSVEAPLSLYLVLALVAGVICCLLACLPGWLARRNERRALLARLRVAEKELDNLRIIPARPDR